MSHDAESIIDLYDRHAEVWDQERSRNLDQAEYRLLLDKHGFEVVTHVVEDPGCGGHTV